MTLIILVAVPIVLAGIMFALYRSRLPVWLKWPLIVVLALFLVRVLAAIFGVFR